MRQGDAADGLYLVGSGRLQVLLTNADGKEVVLNEAGRGELIGEMALLTDKPRSATIVALRDSHVMFLSTEAFGRVVQAHPQAMRVISSALIDKLMNTDPRRGRRRARRRASSILPLDDSPHVREFGARLGRALEPLVGSVTRRHRGRPPAPSSATSRRALARAVWREHLEGVVRRGRSTSPTRSSARGPTNASNKPTSSCSRPRPAAPRIDPPRRTRAPPPSGLRPRNARSWCCCTSPTTSTPRGTRQLARGRGPSTVTITCASTATATTSASPGSSSGQGIGVVFSGGGARGIAHIGAIRALLAAWHPDRRDGGREHRRDHRRRGRGAATRPTTSRPRSTRPSSTVRRSTSRFRPSRSPRARASRNTSRTARRVSTSRTRG